MKRLVIALGLLAGACQTERAPEIDADSIGAMPLGPGTDTSALRSPDTPMTPAGEATPDTVKRKR